MKYDYEKIENTIGKNVLFINDDSECVFGQLVAVEIAKDGLMFRDIEGILWGYIHEVGKEIKFDK